MFCKMLILNMTIALCHCLIILIFNHYVPVSQANCCNMTFKYSWYLFLSHWCDLQQPCPADIRTQLPCIRGGQQSNYPPPTLMIAIIVIVNL